LFYIGAPPGLRAREEIGMKAILVREFGAPELMKLEEVPTPRPGPGQVLVKIHAAGVNPYDTYMRAGVYAIKRVYLAHPLTGSYAEYTLATESQAHRLPERISFSQGAGIYVAYATAYYGLVHNANAHASETVLVHGASGGVGIAAVQIARAMGLTVIGTAGTDKGLELVKKEGAQFVFNHRTPGYQDAIRETTEGRGVDIILEMLANVNLGADLKMLGKRGRVIVIGSRGDVTITPRDLMARRASVIGFTLWGISEADEADVHAAIAAGLENGTMRPVTGKELPLADAPRAHKEIMEPGALGKIVLVP
jgi:NADPH2:quinone reductase